MRNREQTGALLRCQTPAERVERDADPLNEIADRVGGVSIRSVHNYIGAGKLRSVKIGGRRMVLRADLEMFLAKARADAE